MIDGYGTHVPILKKLLKEEEIRYVLEDGGGNHSTGLFLTSGVYLTTVEEDPTWRDSLEKEFHHFIDAEKWVLIKNWEHAFTLFSPDLVLIDGPRETRALRASQAFQRKIPFVIIHDTELPEYYGLTNLTYPGYSRTDHIAADHPKKKQTSVFRLLPIEEQKEQKPEIEPTIHLKIYGLPRTYTNWVAFNIMKTWPTIKVWHNNGPVSPIQEAFWKHGQLKPVANINGYIIVKKDYPSWKRSMLRYLKLNTLQLDPRFLEFVYKGWGHYAGRFVILTEEPCFTFFPSDPSQAAEHLTILLNQIKEKFNLPDNPYHYEEKRMWRAGDASTLEQYLVDEKYSIT